MIQVIYHVIIDSKVAKLCYSRAKSNFYKANFSKKMSENLREISALAKLSERKQTFNEYKTQRGVEEKEEERRQAKENKEKLVKFLETHPKMSSTVRYRGAEEMYRSLTIWNSVEVY